MSILVLAAGADHDRNIGQYQIGIAGVWFKGFVELSGDDRMMWH